jgi:hypothetical protein
MPSEHIDPGVYRINRKREQVASFEGRPAPRIRMIRD